MRGERAVYAYAWDVMEAGVESVAAELTGLGLNTLSLASSYHAGKFIRPRGRSGKVVFPEDGTVYFRPRLERYGHLVPLPHSLVAETDPFAAFSDVRGLALNA